MTPPTESTTRRLRTLGAGAVGAATASRWVESLTALRASNRRTRARRRPRPRRTDWTPTVLTARQNEAVIVLTELIIPATDTPGAKATLVNRFIDGVLADAAAGGSRDLRSGIDVDRRAQPRAVRQGLRRGQHRRSDDAAHEAVGEGQPREGGRHRRASSSRRSSR